jgi:hypothetical protein
LRLGWPEWPKSSWSYVAVSDVAIEENWLSASLTIKVENKLESTEH